MGGKNPALVMPSADLGAAVQGVYRSAFGMNGHKCSACSRVFVHRDMAEEFVSKLREAGRRRVLGDPLDKGVFVGPVATRASYDDYQRYMARRAPRGPMSCARAAASSRTGRWSTDTSCARPCSPGCRATTS